MNENHATDASRSNAISGNRRETDDVLVLPADKQKNRTGVRAEVKVFSNCRLAYPL